MNLYSTIQYLLPGAQFELRDDGAGAYVYAWRDSRPQPTPEQIAAAWHEAQRAAILSDIDAHANRLRTAATAGITPAEMAAWPIKLAQAQSGAGAMIEMEAAARGVTLVALIAKILIKAAVMATLEAQIAGACGRHQDAVRAAADPAGYDWSTGWP